MKEKYTYTFLKYCVHTDEKEIVSYLCQNWFFTRLFILKLHWWADHRYEVRYCLYIYDFGFIIDILFLIKTEIFYKFNILRTEIETYRI